METYKLVKTTNNRVVCTLALSGLSLGENCEIIDAWVKDMTNGYVTFCHKSLGFSFKSISDVWYAYIDDDTIYICKTEECVKIVKL